METETQQETLEKESVKIGAYSILFGDLSNLEALINEAESKISKKGFTVEHFAEMKKIIKRVKNSQI